MGFFLLLTSSKWIICGEGIRIDGGGGGGDSETKKESWFQVPKKTHKKRFMYVLALILLLMTL